MALSRSSIRSPNARRGAGTGLRASFNRSIDLREISLVGFAMA